MGPLGTCGGGPSRGLDLATTMFAVRAVGLSESEDIMRKPRLLDLFSGAGGAGMGYHRAGFEVVGVDIAPQKNYPFEFHRADALDFLAQHGHEYDVIHASPPCQGYSDLRFLGIARNGSYSDQHPLLIKPIQDLLDKIGKPFVIENVRGARKHLRAPVMLCGKYFGLKTYRHRWFEINPFLLTPSHEPHRDSTPSAGHGISPKGFISVAGNGGVKGLTSTTVVEYWSKAMGIDWMTRAELAESIPPAFTEWIGRRLITQNL